MANQRHGFESRSAVRALCHGPPLSVWRVIDECILWATFRHPKSIEIRSFQSYFWLMFRRARWVKFDLHEIPKREKKERESLRQFVQPENGCLWKLENRYFCSFFLFLEQKRSWKFFEWWTVFQSPTTFPIVAHCSDREARQWCLFVLGLLTAHCSLWCIARLWCYLVSSTSLPFSSRFELDLENYKKVQFKCSTWRYLFVFT